MAGLLLQDVGGYVRHQRKMVRALVPTFPELTCEDYLSVGGADPK
jgi:hypothetical protein